VTLVTSLQNRLRQNWSAKAKKGGGNGSLGFSLSHVDGYRPLLRELGRWTLGNVRVENLVTYLESIQTVHAAVHPGEATQVNKTGAEVVPSGEKLYKQDCAVCHGNDLKGNGPAPPPFKDVPPDLTKLAKSHGGKFPEKYFEDVLRNGVPIPAHGSPEMPTWGADFRTREHLDSAQVTLRIRSLSNYIKSLQGK